MNVIWSCQRDLNHFRGRSPKVNVSPQVGFRIKFSMYKILSGHVCFSVENFLTSVFQQTVFQSLRLWLKTWRTLFIIGRNRDKHVLIIWLIIWKWVMFSVGVYCWKGLSSRYTQHSCGGFLFWISLGNTSL